VCPSCPSSTPTPTPTPTPTRTPTPTPTPTPILNPLYISGNTLSAAQLGITTSTYPVYVNWGDGTPVDVFNVGFPTTVTHNYSIPFSGRIIVSSIDLSTIDELFVGCLDVSTHVQIDTTEIAKVISCQSFSGGTNVNVYGDVVNLPNSLFTYSDLSGSITGDIANIPLSITSFESRGSNTLYGDFADWTSTSIINFEVTGNNTIDGDTSSIPSTIQSLELGGFNTIYGTVDDLPTGLINLRLNGNTTVNGRINVLPSNMEVIVIGGSNTVFGEIQNLPSTATYVDIGGNNTIDGDLTGIPTNIIYFSIGGNNTITTYNNRTWSPKFQTLYINSDGSGFDTNEVDQLLNDLASTSWEVGGILTIIGKGSPQYTNVASYNDLVNGTAPVNNPVIVTFL
jgi:hypothetical protein